MTVIGFAASVGTGFTIADDIVVTGNGWSLSTITFYAYQTGSTQTSTFDTVYVRIWDGPPNAGGTVVWGDLVTNRYSSSSFSGIYRDTEGMPGSDQRPIMAIVANVNSALSPGTYWVEFQLGGSLAAGPFVPPTSLLGETSGCAPMTCNALQFTGSWVPLQDGGVAQDVRFMIKGSKL